MVLDTQLFAGSHTLLHPYQINEIFEYTHEVFNVSYNFLLVILIFTLLNSLENTAHWEFIIYP